MINYKTLKHSENGMPTWDAFLGPILQVVNTKDEWARRELNQAVIKEINLPKELANLRYASKYHDLVAINRTDWALSDLKLSGLLISPRRGIYKISDTGKQILNKYGLNITRELVHSQPAYIEHQRKLQEKNNTDEDISEDQTFEITEKQISNWFDKQASDLTEQLLAKLRSTDPYKFEHMMVQLLNQMGYKGTDGQSLVTQKSNDGGIDGIINQDPLGLQTIYVQVKRYAENNVIGSPEIDSFSGALRRKRADRGVFITTSSFTSGAKEAAKQLNIALVDGEMLTNLMVQYKVGVQVQQTYELYDIDDDFFEE
ncbi:Mrr restriction system protein [Lactobacillus helveticus]|uniref:restriction endonuclease n=1 Tax=Lactobacillus helveticus TaxID=1587 RepID=UPI00156260EB|nr:restriction endonuclease [Lactobacillus helveticus]NRN94005.1 Mrr restriction system protein [Lactobacillus helveticus]NRO06317.1 Mrr restriction system protein [Lactobacillus helveticus]NRO37189.1 Mrr restriction system protein [Lactobacillus helveticus]NRO63121.1 Mrr restriction system protein [Lactobacillus helveticus]NRO91249.1 Mrr restriction system protein [Lactobacillus helveticus]